MSALNEPIYELLRELYVERAVYDRELLEPHLPTLIKEGIAVWTVAVSRMQTRFNRYLFLNAPELWSEMDAPSWERLMLSVEDRSYRESDVISTSRFDDVKFLCRLLGIHGADWYFRISGGIPRLVEARSWVKRHVRACAPMYLPLSDMEDLDGTATTIDQLTAARERLMRQADYLRPMLTNDEAIREELKQFVP